METSRVSIAVGLHQASVLGPYVLALVIDELTRHVQVEVLWLMLFAEDKFLNDETKKGLTLT